MFDTTTNIPSTKSTSMLQKGYGEGEGRWKVEGIWNKVEGSNEIWNKVGYNVALVNKG